ncbi:MAG: hypothetical protein ACTSRL_14430 [Candidatus Helarchaeota archaeon]
MDPLWIEGERYVCAWCGTAPSWIGNSMDPTYSLCYLNFIEEVLGCDWDNDNIELSCL